MIPIDSGTRVFPGGLKLLSDGTWIAVHQRDVSPGRAACWAQEAPAITGPWSTPVQVSDASIGSYDPGATRLDDGAVIATWWGSSSSSYAIRLGSGVWGPPTLLRKDKPLGYISDEQTVRRIRANTWQLYSRKPKASPDHVFDLVARTLGDGPVITTEQVVAPSYDAAGQLLPVPLGTGEGAQGKQKRSTVADAGDGHSLVATWARHIGVGLYREIWASVSPDDGVTWGKPAHAVGWAGQDLANPFILQATPSGDELRIYFATSTKGLCHVTSNDHGATWSMAITRDVVDPDTSAARIVVARVGTQLYALCTNHSFTALGIVTLP